jgi:hypothetical protein
MEMEVNLFRNNYSLEEISLIKCSLCDTTLQSNAFGKWCRAECNNCNLFYHFIKEATGYRLTDILWNTRPERRFYAGSKNNIYFISSYPRVEFEIEKFDKETLLGLDKYIKKCDHNWVMDGHNAGDPICSKCYSRE